MRKLDIILSTCIVLTTLLFFYYYNKNKQKEKYYNKLTDSLELIIHNQDSIVNKFKQDTISYNKITVIIRTKYETKYERFANDTIITDDSIANYISKKIHNR